MAKIGLPKGSGKRLKVREKSVKSQGILKWILSGNPDMCRSLYNLVSLLNDLLTAGVWHTELGLGGVAQDFS